jgi:hypothetical protein
MRYVAENLVLSEKGNTTIEINGGSTANLSNGANQDSFFPGQNRINTIFALPLYTSIHRRGNLSRGGKIAGGNAARRIWRRSEVRFD